MLNFNISKVVYSSVLTLVMVMKTSDSYAELQIVIASVSKWVFVQTIYVPLLHAAILKRGTVVFVIVSS